MKNAKESRGGVCDFDMLWKEFLKICQVMVLLFLKFQIVEYILVFTVGNAMPDSGGPSLYFVFDFLAWELEYRS